MRKIDDTKPIKELMKEIDEILTDDIRKELKYTPIQLNKNERR